MSLDMAAVSLTLKPHKTNAVPRWLGRATQAFLLHSIERFQPDLSSKVHDNSDMKPFTASTLIGGEARDDLLRFSPSMAVKVRYTTLHPSLSTLLLETLVPDWQIRGVLIHDQLFEVTAADANVLTNRATGSTSFEKLLESASSHTTLRLTFASPTAFKSTQGHFIPLPQPELVFSSLLARWNVFSPIQLSDDLYIYCHENIALQSVDIRSEEVTFGRGVWNTVSGFTGQAVYHLLGGSEETRRCINALAAFAPYSGVGVKTTVGLGQVRVN